MPSEKTATNMGYMANILKQQHYSIMEHASATFYIEGVSRNLTHELIRHRHLSYSELSQRSLTGQLTITQVPMTNQFMGQITRNTFNIESSRSMFHNRIMLLLKNIAI